MNLWYSNLFFWRKGGGKTQQGVIEAKKAFDRGEIVISNIWLSFPHVRFQATKDLVPILREIANYCNMEKMPILAPDFMLRDYGMKRKKWKIQNYFLLFDEIGNHLNSRNWQKNFSEPILVDMLTEPRKYGLTIVWITQAWARVDVSFRQACEDWFIFSKGGWFIFEQFKYTHMWVHDGEFDFDKPIILDKWRTWIYWSKSLIWYRTLYWTGEIVWAGTRQGEIPHSFVPGSVYSPSLIINDEVMSEANMGGEGESPSYKDTLLLEKNVILPFTTRRLESEISLETRSEDGKSERKNKRKSKKEIPLTKTS